MTESRRLTSVIVPAKNAARFIGEALASISLSIGAIPQVIVVDDASTDDTAAVVRRFAVSHPQTVLLSLPSSVGPGPARNLGLERAEGDYIGFLDAGDRYVPCGLDHLCQALHCDPEIDMVMGRIQVLRKTGTGASQEFITNSTHVRCYQLGSILVRAALFQRVGGFDESFRYGEDIDWFLRVQEAQAGIALTDEVVLHHRRHDDNMSRDTVGVAADMAVVMHGSLKRRILLAKERKVAPADMYYVRPDVTRLDQLDCDNE